ncbi:MAG: cell-division protein septum formation-like protein [Ramlibacter sp.]|nr:cell-division protein septum formation-like protein [Ramlibacter sp.]
MRNRLIPAILIALLLIVHAQLWFGRGSVGSVSAMQQKLDAQKAANIQAQQGNERLASEVRDLKEGLEMVEEKARMELGMVKPNEILVNVGK